MKGYKQLFREHANQDLESCFDMLIGANPHRNIEVFFLILLKQELKDSEYSDLILILTLSSSNIIFKIL